jgi:hypothetical protein
LTLTAALGTPPTQTLNRTNHLAWKALVLPAFRSARVIGLLDGTDRAPPEIIEVEDEKGKKVQVENLAYAAWIERDQLVLKFLLNSLSPDIFPMSLEWNLLPRLGLLLMACSRLQLAPRFSIFGANSTTPRSWP